MPTQTAAQQSAAFAAAGLTASQIAGVQSGTGYTASGGGGGTVSGMPTTTQPANGTTTKTPYVGNSAFDALVYYGGSSTASQNYSQRAQVAKAAGIQNYTGLPSQNVQLISYLQKNGGIPNQVTNGVVTNSAGAVTQFNNNSNTLDELTGNTLNSDALTEIKGLRADMNTQATQFASMYATLKSNNDAMYNKSIESIASKFDMLRTTMEKANQQFLGKTTQNQYAVNGFRYNPQQAEGLVFQAEADGINRLAGIEVDRQEAISKAVEARAKGNAEELDKWTSFISKSNNDRIAVTKELIANADSISRQINSSSSQDVRSFKLAESKMKAQFSTIHEAIKKGTNSKVLFSQLAAQLGIEPDAVEGMYQNELRTRGIQDERLAISQSRLTETRARTQLSRAAGERAAVKAGNKTQNADYQAAQKAIQKGADPAAVWARYDAKYPTKK